jgi:hypothetical protein
VTDSDCAPATQATFHGAVTCGRSANTLTLRGSDADRADDRLILTFVSSSIPNLPDTLRGASVRAMGAQHYRITSESRHFDIEASSLHVHRDIGKTFYRAVPPRRVPLKKRIFLRVVLWLAATAVGKRLLASRRRQA